MLEVGEHHLNLQVDVGGNWGLAEWLKTATHITVHSRGETRAWAVWAILGPFAAILVVDGGDGVIGILPQKGVMQRGRGWQTKNRHKGWKAGLIVEGVCTSEK